MGSEMVAGRPQTTEHRAVATGKCKYKTRTSHTSRSVSSQPDTCHLLVLGLEYWSTVVLLAGVSHPIPAGYTRPEHLLIFFLYRLCLLIIKLVWPGQETPIMSQ